MKQQKGRLLYTHVEEFCQVQLRDLYRGKYTGPWVNLSTTCLSTYK